MDEEWRHVATCMKGAVIVGFGVLDFVPMCKCSSRTATPEERDASGPVERVQTGRRHSAHFCSLRRLLSDAVDTNLTLEGSQGAKD
ncbi:hypothetical protein CEXT_804231 [Caerostris extrusa]|uniref:Uncharacterized protein n=1 Tax=Caerostris extrusa TaxID=172846 RepID=A0AAV4N5P2_CAEEX|nr:hypothetical protein CEXT_804231 [Caerostris extrusa]